MSFSCIVAHASSSVVLRIADDEIGRRHMRHRADRPGSSVAGEPAHVVLGEHAHGHAVLVHHRHRVFGIVEQAVEQVGDLACRGRRWPRVSSRGTRGTRRCVRVGTGSIRSSVRRPCSSTVASVTMPAIR